MRSTCPSCHSAYDIPDALLGAGRRVRCAACGQTWLVEPDIPPPPAEPPGPEVQWAEPPVRADPSPGQLRMQPLDPPDEPRRAWPAWAASVVVIALAGAGAVVWRDQIMRAWPPSARAYQAVGLAAPPATAAPPPPARVSGGSGAPP